ncbi:MAG: O-methyltransferase [Corynebacterium sp.]|uniref:O-methyltransferase n=1 Tax=unclassified Corynebacterium TaxID=2624378 RepID=UPI0026483489|nr:O-methyltransferase [Corynebacterium sp.]MDN5581950.1 O-methyltransferase [Corynebacterium sp.]MDN5719123.1 O-methyltransferase [Corynebacterium sp.]MDN6325871.1 O-methyltransferase [Corynebacterium sp.]MDN6511016.1 O-methyltransferase [Corynebacterium sp.]
MNAESSSALDAVRDYVNSTAATDETLDAARDSANEYGLLKPDAMTGEFLTFLAAQVTSTSPTAVVMSPAYGVIGLHLFAGLPGGGHVTCIDPEVQHQALARSAFNAAGVRSNAYRFLPSAPLVGVSRLATSSYDIIVSQSAVEHLTATVDAALPVLRPGGILVLLDSLLDGSLGDPENSDRQTRAAADAEEHLRSLDDVTVARLPLGAGCTVITTHAAR